MQLFKYLNYINQLVITLNTVDALTKDSTLIIQSRCCEQFSQSQVDAKTSI